MADKDFRDFRQYYYLESYLFDVVRTRFQRQGYLSAFDFFCIVIWKANRSKTQIARRLMSFGYKNLDMAVRDLTQGLAQRSTAKDRFLHLWNRRFRLPMASAILAVLYPDEFTIYDKLVCGILGAYHNLHSLSNFDRLWEGYQEFRKAVEKAAPLSLTLRDKDRYLWGKSFCNQLTRDIENEFKKTQG